MERRERRSDERHRALALFLASCRARSGSHAMSVATPEGALVAGSGDGAILVAALSVTHEHSSIISVTRVEIGSQRWVVASLGSPVNDNVAGGIRRILVSVQREA